MHLTERNRQVVQYAYHGTSSNNVPDILKHGLQPNRAETSYSGDPNDMDASLKTIGGVYLTTLESVALNHAEHATSVFGGQPVIVKVQYTMGSENLDEDDLYVWVRGQLATYPNPRGQFTLPYSEEEVVDRMDSIRERDPYIKDEILDNFRDTFNVADNANLEPLWDIFTLLADGAFNPHVLIYRNAIDWVRVLYDESPSDWQTLRKLIHQVINITKRPIDPNRGDRSFRLTRPVGFKGKTRIVSIEGHGVYSDKVFYQDKEHTITEDDGWRTGRRSKAYYPSGYNPIHQVYSWSKVRRLVRAALAGKEIPPMLIAGGSGGNLLAGTHRSAANDLLYHAGYDRLIDAVELEDVLADPTAYGLSDDESHLLADAVENGDYREIDAIWDHGRSDKDHMMNEDETDHQTALDDTGFWGPAGAGVLIVANDTKRILLPRRSEWVQEPHTWSTWGGAIDEGEDAKTAAMREVEEEAGYDGKILQMVHLYTFTSDLFRYDTFAAVVPNEFEPVLNWETEDTQWVEFGDWPSPLHFGLQEVLKDPSAMNKLGMLTTR